MAALSQQWISTFCSLRPLLSKALSEIYSRRRQTVRIGCTRGVDHLLVPIMDEPHNFIVLPPVEHFQLGVFDLRSAAMFTAQHMKRKILK